MKPDLEIAPEVEATSPISLNDWDTVFAVKYGAVNSILNSGWANIDPSIKNFSKSSDDGTSSISGVFGPWQLTDGGDGENVRLKCPVTSGTYTIPGNSYDLSNVDVTIEVQMQWLPDPSQKFFVVDSSTVAGSTMNSIIAQLDLKKILPSLSLVFATNAATLSSSAAVTKRKPGNEWSIYDSVSDKRYYLFRLNDDEGDPVLNVYEFTADWKANLTALERDAGTGPASTVVDLDNVPSIKAEVYRVLLGAIFDAWFQENLEAFSQVFAMLNVSTEIDLAKNWEWIRPTDTSYAVVDTDSVDNGVFGVLTMIQGNEITGSHTISEYAIPDKADAAFLISGPQFVRNILIGGAKSVFHGSSTEDFSIENDGMSITNNKELVWGNFVVDDTVLETFTGSYGSTLDAGKVPSDLTDSDILNLSSNLKVEGSQGNWTLKDLDYDKIYALEEKGSNLNVYDAVEIKVQPQGFSLDMNQEDISLVFKNVVYPGSWSYNVTMNYSETIRLVLKDVGGKKVITFEPVKDGTTFTAEVDASKAAIEASIILSITTALIGIVIAFGGPLFNMLKSACTCADEAGDAVLSVSSEAYESAASANETELQTFEEDAADNAANTAGQNAGKWASVKGALLANKYKIMSGIAGTLFASTGPAAAGIANDILQAQATDDWSKVPGFDHFAGEVIDPYMWPELGKFDLFSISQNGVVQIGLKAK